MHLFVPVRLRVIVPLVVVAIVVVFASVQRRASRDAAAAPGPPAAPFPARVVAEAPRLPQYAEAPRARILQQMASADAMWRKAFAAVGDDYTPAKLADGVPGECHPSGGWAGLYCGRSQEIVIDVDAHVARYEAAGGGLSDVALGYIVAHEVGHHVQRLRNDPLAFPDTELHADCLAGVWGKAAGLPLPPVWLYGADDEHGTAQQRIEWLNTGYRNARPADCDAMWRPQSAS